MVVLSDLLHRFLSPFIAGGLMAGATLTESIAAGVLLGVASSIFVYASLPPGGRLIKRLTGVL